MSYDNGMIGRVATLHARIATLEAENERLREALERVCREGCDWSDDESCLDRGEFGDDRCASCHARAALQPEERE